MNTIPRLTRTDTTLAIIDLQDGLVAAMFEKERLLKKAHQLARGAAVLGIPVLGTVQYPKGLGPTVSEVSSAIPRLDPMEKMSFSACGEPRFLRALKAKNVSSVILCGIESHVCVCQTCLDLIENDFAVFVAADAISSRTNEDCQIGIDRMRRAGAVICSTEMALFELLGGADRPEFKEILGIVK